MRRLIAIGIAGICLVQFAAEAHERAPSGEPPRTLSSALTKLLPFDVRTSGDRLVFISAGVVFAGLAMNFVSGGMVAALFGFGASNIPASSLATFAAGEVTWHATVWGVGPATVMSVGQPVDAALRDPSATPATFADAFAESGRRAKDLAEKAGRYVGTTVGGWLGAR